jgi:hypothetical protein
MTVAKTQQRNHALTVSLQHVLRTNVMQTLLLQVEMLWPVIVLIHKIWGLNVEKSY